LLAYFEDREAQADKKGYLENLLKKQEELNILSSRVFGFIHLNMSADTQNPEAKQAYVKMQALSGKFALIDTKFKTHLSTLEDLEGLVEDSPYLRKYAFLLAEAKEEIAHTLSADLEYLASELRQNGSSLWSQLQRHMTSMAEIDFRGKKLSLTEIRNLAYSSDPEERKEAYFKELEIYEKIEDAVAFALAGIKGEVNTMVKHRKFASPLDEALFNSRMKKETLDALLEAMKESLPVFRKYLRHKAKLLGHENGLPWYDLFAPLGKSEKKYTVEEAQEFILRQFGSFSEDLRNLAERAFRNNWIDYLPRKGKVGGAFCSNNLALKESRILTNFGGEIGDVITIAHELGHAYHGTDFQRSAPEQPLHDAGRGDRLQPLRDDCETGGVPRSGKQGGEDQHPRNRFAGFDPGHRRHLQPLSL
jgi:oligoendopeptidase F